MSYYNVSLDGANHVGFTPSGPGNLSLDPLFDPAEPDEFLLLPASPCIDAGDPALIYQDLDGSRNDIGATGGPCSATGPSGSGRENGFIFTSVGTIPTLSISIRESAAPTSMAMSMPPISQSSPPPSDTNTQPFEKMKSIFTVILSITGLLHAAPGVAVRGIATAGKDILTLDLFADTESGDQLRSFGLLVKFDPEVLQVRSLTRFETLWFLSPDGGTTTSEYFAPTSSEKSSLELLGLRFDGTAPTTGVTGESLLLASVVFDPVKEGDPGFVFSLARPDPFVNFSLADGSSLDDNVSGLGNLTAGSYDPVIGALPGSPGIEVEESADDAASAFYALKVGNSTGR